MDCFTNLSRRKVLLVSGAAISTGLAGCTGSGEPADSGDGDAPNGDDTENNPDDTGTSAKDSAVIEDIRGDGRDLKVTLADDADIDQIQLLNSDRSEYDTASVSGSATTVSITLIEIGGGMYHDGYTPGEHTLVALSGEEVVEEHVVDLAPQLRLTTVDMEYMRRTDHEVHLEIENIGSGPAYIDGGGFESDYLGSNSSFVPSGGVAIGVGESETFEERVSLPEFDDREVGDDEFCTGEDAFIVGVTVTVEEPTMGDLSGEINIAGRGAREYVMIGSNRYTCTESEAMGLPVELN